MMFAEALLDFVEGASIDRPVAALADETGGTTCLQLVHLGPAAGLQIVASARIDPDLVGTLERLFMQPETNPIIRNIGRCGFGRLRKVQEFVDQDEYYRSAFYADISVPGGAGQCAMMQLDGQRGRYMLPVTIGSGYDWFSTSERESFENNVRSLARAVDLRSRLSVTEASSRSADGELLHLDCMIDENGAPISATDVVFDLLQVSGPCTIRHGRLMPLASADEDRWSRTFLMSLGGQTRRSVFANADGRYYSVRFSPGPALAHGRTVIVSISRIQSAQWDRSSLEALLGLSARESDVTMALLQGKSPAAIAGELGLKANSVRIYLQQIYSKTGTDGQRGLMAKLNGVPAD